MVVGDDMPLTVNDSSASLPGGGDFHEQKAVTPIPRCGNMHNASVCVFVNADIDPLLGREVIDILSPRSNGSGPGVDVDRPLRAGTLHRLGGGSLLRRGFIASHLGHSLWQRIVGANYCGCDDTTHN
jgi:hypothetical protein